MCGGHAYDAPSSLWCIVCVCVCGLLMWSLERGLDDCWLAGWHDGDQLFGTWLDGRQSGNRDLQQRVRSRLMMIRPIAGRACALRHGVGSWDGVPDVDCQCTDEARQTSFLPPSTLVLAEPEWARMSLHCMSRQVCHWARTYSCLGTIAQHRKDSSCCIMRGSEFLN